MFILEFSFLIFGIVLLVVGYRRNNRNTLLVAGLLLLLTGFIRPIIDGYRSGLEGNGDPSESSGLESSRLDGAAG
jgi:uncharacterized membrane protein